MNERKQKKCRLRPEWIKWWRDMISKMSDRDHNIQSGNVIYRVNHSEKTVTLVNGTPLQPILDKRCVEACGYKYDVFMDPTAATIVAIKSRDPRTIIFREIVPGVTIVHRGTRNQPGS